MQALLAVGLGVGGCTCDRPEPPVEPKFARATSGAQVSVVSDGERVGYKSGISPSMRGESNPVWKPGEPLRLFGLRGETIAFQVVVSAGAAALSDVRVELGPLSGPAELGSDQIERFLVVDLLMARRSGGKFPGESLGWEKQATPAAPAPGSGLPDPLIPVSLAPAWAPYPMRIPAGEQRVVWIDLNLAGAPIAPGNYSGKLKVTASELELSEVPVELKLGEPELPYAALESMLYFDPEEITGRVGSAKAVEQYLQLVHAHHLSSIFPIRAESDVSKHAGLFDGSLFTSERGYRGAGAARGTRAVAIGAYGSLREPTPEKLAAVEGILTRLSSLGVKDEPGARDVFLYAVDEQCDSPRGREWKQALAASSSAALRGLRVGHTCSEPPEGQAVDLVMMFASAYSPEAARAGAASGKRVWIYNGVLPQTGSFLTDSPVLSLRANAWIQARYGIERWFYWESTFWNDDNKGGLGPYDAFATAETFHNQHGDHANGDGVLVYPGRQAQFPAHDLGFDGVVPSIRLKQWRRGLQDAGYLKLARAVDPARVDGLLKRLIPSALTVLKGQPAPRWSTQAADWEAARRELFDLLNSRKAPVAVPSAAASAVPN